MPWLDSLLQRLSLNREFYGNSLRQWLIALLIFAAVWIALRLALALARRRATRLAESGRWEFARGAAGLLDATRRWFLLAAALFAGTLVLQFPEGHPARHVIQSAAAIALVVQGGIWGNVCLAFGINRYVKTRMASDAAAATTITALGFLGKLVLWSLVILLVLDNLGVQVTALIAGLGVGGVAVALAAQNILGDLFASLSIVMDKPFVLGDVIAVGDFQGTVENIGLKTTRLRSISGEQLIFANNDLLQSRIRNYKRMHERRVVFSLGVTYDTSRDTLAAIPGILRGIIESQEKTRFDRSHFQKFGDSALIFETVYYVTVPDFNLHMDIQQAINLAIYDRFTTDGIEFAFPTQTTHVRQIPLTDKT
jgi:small-conductance mechanosensitive channel